MKDRLKAVRLALGYSQEGFAEKLGISRSAVSLYESGARNMGAPLIRMLCSAFGVSREYLEEGTGEMFSSPDEPMEALAARYGLSDADCRLVMAFCRMPPGQRKAVRDLIEAAGRASMDDAAYAKT